MHYFAYGSNINIEQMARRCAGARLVGRASLSGYTLTFGAFSKGWNAGVADVVPLAGSTVWGLLFSVTGDEIAELDRYEGHPHQYTRTSVTVLSPAGPAT